MDERKKEIRMLETRNRENATTIETCLEKLGASLVPRLDGGSEEYHALQKEIAGSGEAIRGVTSDVERLKALDGEIRNREHDQIEEDRAISRLYARIGELIMEYDEYSALTAPFRAQADTLVPKINSLKMRLDALEEKSDNVFARIGRGAQGIVLRSFLIKNQNNLERIYAAAGEHFVLRNGTPEPARPVDEAGGAVRETLDRITASRKSRDAAAQELALLREERRRINEALAAEGGAARKIQLLEKNISRAREDLAALYRRAGGEAETGEGPGAERRGEMLEAADIEALEQIRRLRDAVRLNGQRIGRLETAIAIDETNADIAKMEEAVKEHRRRIQESENAAANLERLIARSRERVETLSRELADAPGGAEDPAEDSGG
ncbi:MAG: hypothetical protein LBC88_04360 [Spirochaetaceae bacterium]|jgi:chromosome segregation ATPase|nr:hypothetical protein [Spirochaetaceae bacterium]